MAICGIGEAEDDRKKRLFASYIAGGLALALRIGQQLVLLPVFLLAWAAPVYQDWLVITAGAAFFALADLGTRPFLHNRLLMAWAGADMPTYHRMAGIGLFLAFGFSAFGVVLAIGAAALAYELGFLSGYTIPPAVAGFVFAGMAVRAVLEIPADILGNPYWARREVARSINVSTAFAALELAVVIAAVVLGCKPQYLPLAFIAPKLCMIAFVMLDVRIRYAELEFRPVIPTRAEATAMVRVGLAYSFLPAAQLVSFQGVIIVLGAVAPEPLAVVVFTAIRTLAGFVRQVAERVAGLTGAEMARSFGAQDQRSLVHLYAHSGRIVGGLAGLLAGAAYVFAPSFLQIWSGGNVPFNAPVLAGLLAALLLGLPGQSAIGLFAQINRPAPLVFAMAVQAATALLLSAALGAHFGAAGAAIAVAIAECLSGAIIVPAQARKALGLPLLPHVARTWTACVAGVGISLPIAGAATEAIGGEMVWHHILAASTWAVMTAGPAVYLLLNANQRRWLVRTCRSAIFAGQRAWSAWLSPRVYRPARVVATDPSRRDR